MRSRPVVCVVLAAVLLISFVVAIGLQADTSPLSARIVVMKPLRPSADADTPPYAEIDEEPILAAGFARIAEYATRSLYEGPELELAALIDALADAGYLAYPTDDMDTIRLLGHDVDADTGSATPPYADSVPLRASDPAASRLYLLALRGYPTQEWLDDLSARGVEIVEPLPPASYIVHAADSTASTLVADTSYTRGVFPMTAAMKSEPVRLLPADTERVYRPVSISAFEHDDAASIQAFLESVAEPDSLQVISRNGPRVQYGVNLTDLDIATLASFDAVVSISSVSPVGVASERQGMLIAAPDPPLIPVLGLPQNVAYGGYTNYIKSPSYKNISDFGNTKVAMLDTGFDDPGSPVHPDFTCVAGVPNCSPGTSLVVRDAGGQPLNQTTEANADNVSHGTISASVITGYPPAGTRKDSGSYRYGLGIAPTVVVAMDKFIARLPSSYTTANANPLTRLQNAMTALAPFAPNVVNHSWNAGITAPPTPPTPYANYCGYDDLAQYLDKHTRLTNTLHIVSAGNGPDAPCPYVRSPATAHNVIAVGATENFTLGWSNSSGSGYANTCASNYFPSSQDARNIATFSAYEGPGSPPGNIIKKPDVVAPGLRVTAPWSTNTVWQSGNGVFCNKNVASFTNPTVKYGMSAGTSFSAPVVTGIAALVRKWFQRETGLTSHSPALTKAMIISGAMDNAGGKVRSVTADGTNPSGTTITTVGSDRYQGWGFASVVRLLGSFANNFYVDQTTVLTPAAPIYSRNFTIVNGATKTRIVLTWTDRYSATVGGTAGEAYKSTNKLTMDACKDGVGCYYSNIWSGSQSQLIPPGGSIIPDSWNNVQYIIIPANVYPSGSVFTLHVSAYQLTGDGVVVTGTTLRQDFAVFAVNAH